MATLPLRIARKSSRLSSADIDAMLDGPRSTVPVTVTPLTDQPGGPRIIGSPTSGLILGIAAIDQIDALTAYENFARCAGYSCIANWSVEFPFSIFRPGETTYMARRIGEHRAAPPCTFEHVLLVGSADPFFSPFGRDETIAIQWALYRLAERAGRVLLHGAAPARPALLDHNSNLVAQWVADLKTLLPAAGVMACEPRGRILGPVDDGREAPEAFVAVSRGYEKQVPPGLTERADAIHYDLAWNRVHALVTVVDRWTIIHAGSTADPDDRSGIQGCIALKRVDLLNDGVLQRTRCGHLWRFTCDIAVPSLTNAIRTITGTNLPKDRFRLAA